MVRFARLAKPEVGLATYAIDSVNTIVLLRSASRSVLQVAESRFSKMVSRGRSRAATAHSLDPACRTRR
jgi:hypothetical protein